MLTGSDSQIFEAIKRDDNSAYEMVFREYYRPMTAYAFRFLGNLPDSESIVQDVFLRLWQKRKDIMITSSLQNYLFRSVKNNCINYIEHEKIKTGYQSLVIRNEADRSEYSEFFLEFGLTTKIEAAIASLPEKRQEIFRLAREDGFKYAAMIVVVLGIGFATFKIIKSSEKSVDTPVLMTVANTEAHPANFTVITLPDGSTVKMNASTRIEYPEHFAADIRKVKLSGEAFFEVTRDTLHPFIIETVNASVEVLGTSFNVSAYPEAGLVEVNVKTGKVKLTQLAEGNSTSKSAILPAGERGWLDVVNGKMGQDMIVTPNYSAWITKEIIFQRTPLTEAFSILENTYHVKIKMENPEIGKIPYTANFANQELDYITDVLARTHQLKFVRNGDQIIFAKVGK